jgi:uncharacterized protein (DUF1800 family)
LSFSPTLAERRFGFGLSPHVAQPQSVDAMLFGINGPDVMQEAHPLPNFRALQDKLVLRRRFRGFARKNPETAEGKEADQKQQAIYREARDDWTRWFVQLQRRRILTPHAFRERMIAFWADHFTAVGKGGMLRFGMTAYVEDAVRPHVNGSFGEMLQACVTHPLMLDYLDQNTSAGPGSILVRRRPRRRGLNENLAREVLELHTVGVDGPYTQADVRELAELFTGLSRTRDYGFVFRRNMAEPGAETVLGKTYGQGASLQYVKDVLNDLALHPATATHIARKLAAHFVSDTPPDALVAHIAHAYLVSDGDLRRVYAALLEHPSAWSQPSQNIRPPQEFMSTTLRAFGGPSDAFAQMKPGKLRQIFFAPLRLMGQPWESPAGPDGWAEEDAAWITPQGIAARLEWAVQAPSQFLDALPDPRVFVDTALGDAAGDEVRFAAKAAENRAEAVGLVLASPEFQRR